MKRHWHNSNAHRQPARCDRAALRARALCACALLAAAIAGCEEPWGKPRYEDRPLRPSEVVDFDPLFQTHCAGCHGADGRLGPAPPLNDQVFLTIVPDEVLRDVITQGREGSLMPAFAASHGGSLTEKQVGALVDGIRHKWQRESSPDLSVAPAYLASQLSSEGLTAAAQSGEATFAKTCASCHGEGGRGGDAGAIRNPDFLALTSDQALRRVIITGRPDLGMPDFRGLAKLAGQPQPLTDEEVTNLAALLASWRSEAPVPATDASAPKPGPASSPRSN
jgi:cytochrome c oxidase cbb3-type subunit 3